jgi:hypothetical protein
VIFAENSNFGVFLAGMSVSLRILGLVVKFQRKSLIGVDSFQLEVISSIKSSFCIEVCLLTNLVCVNELHCASCRLSKYIQ